MHFSNSIENLSKFNHFEYHETLFNPAEVLESSVDDNARDYDLRYVNDQLQSKSTRLTSTQMK